MKTHLHIALMQPNIVWENPEANLDLADKMLKKVSPPTELIIFPEAFTTGFTMNQRFLEQLDKVPGLSFFKNKAREMQKVIIVGLFAREDGLLYNRYYWFNPDGSYVYYNKRHLFSAAGEDNLFTAGTDQLIVRYEGFRFNLNLCYDLRFPVWTKNRYDSQTGQYAYDFLIYGANWPEKRKNIYLPLLRARAIENQAYVLWSNRVGRDKHYQLFSGDSRVVNPLGQVEITTKTHQERVEEYRITIEKLHEIRSKMPVGKDWDAFTIL
ncbi:MAG: nitrilase family protein [Chlorobi bacterium]|nr:nitrilase family protein [Chlorobiota bacterium]